MTNPPVHGATETDLGWAAVAVSSRGITRSTLFGSTRSAVLAEAAGWGSVPGDNETLADALATLAAYASGKPGAIETAPIDLRQGSDLDRRIWLALRAIPRGETRTYSWLAQSLTLPAGAARAIGSALARNPIPIWLPCHRVIGRDGTLRGFGGGIEMKRRLLVLEGALPAELPG